MSRYSVRLFLDLDINTIRQSIINSLPNIDFNSWKLDKDEFCTEKFEVSIDDGESVCFYFHMNKLDKKYINSIILPIIENLGIPNEYNIYDYKTDKEISIN